MKKTSDILSLLTPQEKKLLLKILDHRAAERLNGFSREFEENILQKTQMGSLNELLSRIHAELIHSDFSPEVKEETIKFWLNDPRLLRLQLITDQAVRILDNQSKKYLYINEVNESMSGYPNQVFVEKGLAFSNSRTHPWDLFQLLLIIQKVMKIYKKLSKEEKLSSRFTFDLRYKHPVKGYIRVLQHVLPLSLDPAEKPAISMVLSSDISKMKSDNSMTYHFGTMKENRFDKLLEGKTDVYGNILTIREIEVLTYAADGFTSIEIADKLNLSSETVKTHYKNILQKTTRKNMTEVVKIAVLEGWI